MLLSWVQRFAVVVFALAGFPAAQAMAATAQTSSTSTSTLRDSTIKAPLKAQPSKEKKKERSYSLALSFGQEAYVSRTPEVTGTTEYTEIGVRARAHTDSKPVSATVELGGSLATDVEDYQNFEVPEVYATATTVDTAAANYDPAASYARVDLGRKKEAWSTLDSEWSSGIVQPLNRFDGLRPSEQGLTGVFAKAGQGGVDVTLFGSPLFIPEQGSPFKNENGRFETSNPWFTAPPDTLILTLGPAPVRSPVNYTLNIPETQSVITQTSLGAMVRVSDPNRKDGFYVQGSALRKPQNALALSFTGKLSLTDDSSYGDVNVYPEVVYHQVYAADVGYTSKFYSFGLAALHEKPEQPTTNAELTTQSFSDMTMLSPSVEFRPFASRVWAPRLRFSYLDTDGGEVSAVGKFAQNGNVFGPRVMFRRAVSASFNTTLYRSRRLNISAGARWIEELSEQGSIFMSDVRFGIGDSWLVAFQADVLGSRQPTTNIDSFIARYRANDRVSGRLTYLF